MAADTIKEVLDFAFRFDTKQATRELRSMQTAFKTLSSKAREFNKLAQEDFKKVGEAVSESIQEVQDLKRAYAKLKEVDNDFARAAVKGWSKIEGVVEDALKAQEDYAKVVTELQEETEKLTKAEKDLAEAAEAHLKAELKASKANLEAKQALRFATTEQEKAEARLKQKQAGAAVDELLKATKEYEKQTLEVKKTQKEVAKLDSMAAKKRSSSYAKSEAATTAMQGISSVSSGANRAAERIMSRNEEQAKAVESFQDSLSDYDFKAAGTDFGEGATEVIDALKGRDPLGIAKGLAQMALKPIGMGAGKGIQKAAMMGGADSAMAGLSKTMSGLVGTFAKVGPMVSVLGGAIVGLVKMFLDADAAAKEFNRDLLAGGSTAEFLTQGTGRARDAMKDLGSALDEVRNAAMDSSFNNSLGITSKEHSAFLSTLQREGKTLKSMAKDADAAKMSMGNFTKELLTVGVTYSRNFGVSLDEIGQMTGQLMTETGMSLKSVETSFNQVLLSSKDSGIGANKFFNIIRSMSAELTLFTFRLEEAAQVLKAVGKAMSARTAEKFLQTVSQFYKGMGFQDRIKQTLMGGGAKATGDRLTKGFDKRKEALSYDFEKATGEAGSGEALKAAMAGSKKDLAVFLAKYGDKIESGMRESIVDAQRFSKQAQGGLVNVSSALRGADIGTTIDQLNAISKNLVGTKLSESQEINYMAISQLTGLTEEQIDMFHKLEMSMDIMRQEMALRAKAGVATEADKEFLRKSGVKDVDKLTPEEMEKAIQSLDDTTFFNSLSEDQKKAAQGIKETRNYAEEQTTKLQDLNTKIENFIQFMTNQFYNLVMKIYDAFVDSPIFGNSEKRTQRDFQKKFDAMGGSLGTEFSKGKTVEEGAANVKAALQAKYGKNPGDLGDALPKAFETAGVDTSLRALQKVLTPEQLEKFNSKTVQAGGKLAVKGDIYGSKKGGVGAMLNEIGGLQDPAQAKALMDALVSEMNVYDLASFAASTGPVTATGAPAVTAPVRPNTPSGQTPATVETAENQTKAVEAQTAQQAEDAKKIHKVMKQEGIKVDKATIDGPMKKSTQDATLEALRKALFEQYLYKDVPVEQMIKGIQSGAITESGPGAEVYNQVRGSGKAFDPTAVTVAPPNAEGGMVLKPAAGEYLASVAPGERILPRGSGGGGGFGPVSLTVNGDAPANFKRIMEEKIRQGFDEYRKMQRSGDLKWLSYPPPRRFVSWNLLPRTTAMSTL